MSEIVGTPIEGAFGIRDLGNACKFMHLQEQINPHEIELAPDQLLMQYKDGRWAEWEPESLDKKHPLYPLRQQMIEHQAGLLAAAEDYGDMIEHIERLIINGTK